MNGAQRTLYIVQCIVYNVQYTMFNLNCTLNTEPNVLYTLRYTDIVHCLEQTLYIDRISLVGQISRFFPKTSQPYGATSLPFPSLHHLGGTGG